VPYVELPPLPGIVGLLVQYPQTGGPLNGLADALLRGPSSLSPADRETIAAFVSARNECTFCAETHGAVARHLHAAHEHTSETWTGGHETGRHEAGAQHADGHEADAQHADGHDADAQHADGHEADAQHADGHETDAQHADRHETDAQHADRHDAGGRTSGLGQVDDVIKNGERADVGPKLQALLAIAEKVRLDGRSVSAADVQRAREAGADDKAIHDTVLIAAAFCMFNRYVDGLATVSLDRPEDYAEHAKPLAEGGYLQGRPPRP
jgi:AhpD family alkylhydroperoxidase